MLAARGLPGAARTRDFPLRRRALCPLSYRENCAEGGRVERPRVLPPTVFETVAGAICRLVPPGFVKLSEFRHRTNLTHSTMSIWRIRRAGGTGVGTVPPAPAPTGRPRRRRGTPAPTTTARDTTAVRRTTPAARLRARRAATPAAEAVAATAVSRRDVWSGWPDSNRRPLAPEASALPSCATAR